MLASRATSAFDVLMSSGMLSTNASEVSFTSVMISLLIAGKIRLMTCGSTIFMNVWNRVYPSTFAASY